MTKHKKHRNRNIQKVRLLIALTLILLLLLVPCFTLHEQPEDITPSVPPTETSGSSASPAATEGCETDSSTYSGVTQATSAEHPDSPEEITLPLLLDCGLTITDIGKYAGLFVEDGSDEPVSNILMIQVENTTDKDLYLAAITMTIGNQTASFQLTNLPAGAQAVLLEQNRMEYTDQMPTNIQTENEVFTEKFSMCEDRIKVTALNGVINVENISGTDIPDDIYVYYKNYAGGIFHGGITYRVRITGGLKSGEIRQLIASRFYENSSRLLMVSIGG